MVDDGKSQSGASRPLILASTSPRRVDLLQAAGLEFRAVAPEVAETQARHLSAGELTACNAWRKARAVAAQFPAESILGADTVVVIEGCILGKPEDLADARRMLSLLAGREHQVLTSFCLLQLAPRYLDLRTERSRVFFHPLDAAAIEDYLGKIHSLDKAGAYAAQEYAHLIIDRIEGSTTNVIGLPMEALREALGRRNLIT